MQRAQFHVVGLVFVLLSFGCGTTPAIAPAPREKDAVRRQVEEPAALPREIPAHRRPSRVGDVIVYPCQWRDAGDLGYRLYHLLYPKYGPYLQIVPDRQNNTLLIYLPPRGSRWDPSAAQGVEF